MSKHDSFIKSDEDRRKARAMQQQGVAALGVEFEDGVPVGYGSPAARTTAAKRSIRAGIREYVEARGGIKELTEAEKSALAKLPRLVSLQPTDVLAIIKKEAKAIDASVGRAMKPKTKEHYLKALDEIHGGNKIIASAVLRLQKGH